MNSLSTVSFSGLAVFDLFGQGGNDQIFGSPMSEYISGGTGRDTIRAGGGDDHFSFAPGDDTAGEVYDGGSGRDSFSLTSFGSETLNLRDDTLVSIEEVYFSSGSSTARDTILLRAAQFGSGISTTAFINGTADNPGGQANLSDRIDIVMDTAVSLNLSGLTIFSFSDPQDRVVVTGDADAETITGSSVADIIDAKAGADNVGGGAGNDVIYVDNAGDVVREAAGGGSDMVLTTVSYTLTAGAEAEVLSTTNAALTATLQLAGNAYGQTITGNAGTNTLNGMGGADTLRGLGGSDTYYVDQAGDVVSEAVGGGTDTVLAAQSYALGGGQEIETLATTSSAGTGTINLTGNSFAQAITGNNGSNTISGMAGNDTLRGLGGADTFLFDTALNASTNVDTIADFNAAQDTMRLENAIFTALTATGTLSAGAFQANATGLATEADDRIVYETDTGKLFYDSNGSASGGATQFALISGHPTLTYTDFVVV